MLLFCVIVGEGRPFPVEIDASATVGQLKDTIKEKKVYRFGADALELSRVQGLRGDRTGNILFRGTRIDMASCSLDFFGQDTTSMDPKSLISTWIDTPQVLGDETIHVLVSVTPNGLTFGAICPRVCVADLLRSNVLPDDLEFVQAMDEPLGFKIPVKSLDFASTWPDVFSFGAAEYGCAVSYFLEHPNLRTSEAGVTSPNSAWLYIFDRPFGCRHYRDEWNASSSRAHSRLDEVIGKGSAMVGKYVAKLDVTDLQMATVELTSNLTPLAYNTFPRGRSSIPAWTTCATHIELHQLAHLPSTQTYVAIPLKTYYVDNEDERVRFVVDVFKIVKWTFAIQKPNAAMHLFPGVRTKTRTRRYVTWAKDGLIKEYGAEVRGVDMALIERVYNADLAHIERGFRSGNNTVTITSVGQTLTNSTIEVHLPRAVILAQVRAALDELHSINVAHCDVKAANLFVLADQRVILGGLEYCRPLDAAPPLVRCFPKNESYKTALECDEYQHRMLQEELAAMGI